MELESFDLIANLVPLGLGASIVPKRLLSLYARRKTMRAIPLEPKFTREVIVATRKSAKLAGPVKEFVENVMF